MKNREDLQGSSWKRAKLAMDILSTSLQQETYTGDRAIIILNCKPAAIRWKMKQKQNAKNDK